MAQFRRAGLAAVAALLGLAGPCGAAQIELLPQPGAFRVVNTTGAALRLRTAVGVQRRVGDVWMALPLANLNLIAACAPAEPPACIDIAAGASISPPPWTGLLCASQCPQSCGAEGRAPAGVYRYAVQTCEGGAAGVSEAFERK